MPETKAEEPRFEDEFDFSQYGRFVARYWPFLAVCALAGGIIGLAQAMRKPILYEASTTVLATSQATPQLGIATSRALLENNTLAAQTLQETGLNQPPYNLTPQGFVGGALQVEQVAGTNLMRVKVRLGDGRKAAEASTILSRKAVELNRRIADAQSVAVGDQLAGHLQAASERLQKAEQQLLSARKDAQFEVLERDTDAMLDKRGELSNLLVQIEVEKSRLAAAEEELSRHERVLSLPRMVQTEEALRRAIPQRERSDLLTTNAGTAGTAARDGAGGSAQSAATLNELAAPHAPSAETLDLTNGFINPVYQTLAFQIATSRTRLAGLERQRQELVKVGRLSVDRVPKLSELYERELALAKVQAGYDLAKRVHEDLALRLEQSRTESVDRMIHLQVIDEAIPADRPLPQKRVQSTALGLTVGLLLGILAALVREALWTSAVARNARAQ